VKLRGYCSKTRGAPRQTCPSARDARSTRSNCSWLRDDEHGIGAPALVMLPGDGLGAGAFLMVFAAFAAVAPRDAMPFGSIQQTHRILPLL